MAPTPAMNGYGSPAKQFPFPFPFHPESERARLIGQPSRRVPSHCAGPNRRRRSFPRALAAPVAAEATVDPLQPLHAAPPIRAGDDRFRARPKTARAAPPPFVHGLLETIVRASPPAAEHRPADRRSAADPQVDRRGFRPERSLPARRYVRRAVRAERFPPGPM